MGFNGKNINSKYMIASKIAEDSICTSWKAIDLHAQNEYMVKFLKKDITSDKIEDLIRFRNEVKKISSINNQSIIKIYEVGQFEEHIYIVNEYFEGESLEKYILKGRKFSKDEAVKVVYNICQALKCIHTAGLISQDLMPENIILSPADYGIKLVNLGFSQVRKFNAANVEVMKKHLLYMSPEQSGVIKRIVDERSDIYSLGILFYQLLTNKLPFESDNINTIIYQHAAKIPLKPNEINSEIPDILSKMVLKMVEKEVDRRYQSINGLLKDLEYIINGNLNFVIGSSDRIERIDFHSSLVGRDTELEILKDSYDKTTKGKGSICLIGGEAGKGKTRLTEELQKYVFKNNGLCLQGKCFSGVNKAPYGVLIEVINKYINEFNNFENRIKDEVRKSIKNNLGNLRKVVLKLTTAAAELIGNCPTITELNDEDEKVRFNMVISKMFFILSSLKKPIVLILDDLQWVDEGTMAILNELANDIGSNSMLILGTYRDNEVTETHILQNFIHGQKDNKNSLTQIILKPFDKNRMVEFTKNILIDSGETIDKIAEYILQKSNGNPFHSIEIIKQLINQGAIFRENFKWQIDFPKFNSIEIPTSIVDILLERISALNEDEINILSHASVIGKSFDMEILFKLHNFETEYILSIIDKMLKQQLLEVDFNDKNKIVFCHDRIKEAFYKKMSSENTRIVHNRIAKIIDTGSNDDIFSLAHHYYEAGNVAKTLEYAFPAGELARKSYSYEIALKYYLISLESCEKLDEKYNDIWLKSKDLAGNMYKLMGMYEEAIECFNELIPFIADKMEKVKVYGELCVTYSSKGDWKNAYNSARIAFKLFGIRLPMSKFETIIGIAKEMVIRKIYSYIHKNVYTQKIQKENCEKYLHLVPIYLPLGVSAILNDLAKYTYLTFKLVNIVESKVGCSRDLGICLTGLGFFQMSLGQYDKSKDTFEKSLVILKYFQNEVDLSRVYFGIAFMCEWTGDYKKAYEYFDKSRSLNKKLGSMRDKMAILNGIIHQPYHLANYKKMKKLLDEYYQIALKTKDHYSISAAYIYYVQYFRETGDYEQSEKYGSEGLKYSEKIKDMFNFCSLKNEIGTTLIESGNLPEAIAYLEVAKDIDKKNKFVPQYIALLYANLADAYIEFYKKEGKTFSKKEKVKYLNKISRELKTAMKKTKKLATHYGKTLRVYGKYFFLIGKYNEAEIFFNKSINHCQKHSQKYEEAKCLYEYGQFLMGTGITEKSNVFHEKAYSIFKEIGAKAYELKTATILGISKENYTSAERFAKDLRYAQRLSSIILLSQELSSILNIDEMFQKALNIALEITGAQNGYFLTKDHKSDEIKLLVSNRSDNINTLTDVIPIDIINSVLEKGETIILTNAIEDNKYVHYRNEVQKNLKSVLCTPIKFKNEIKGVCYLDNPLSSSVFTSDDKEILNVIMTQVAISLENANLYQNLEYLVDERTAELQKTLDNLKSTQEKLHQSEKMASLSRMVVGVAHEINTPLGVSVTASSFINGLIKELENSFYKNASLHEENIRKRFNEISETMDLLTNSLKRSVDLINKFKSISINQDNEKKYFFNLKTFISEVLHTFKSELINNNIKLKFTCNDDIDVESYPNSLLHILNNLFLNTIVHAFSDEEYKVISIDVYQKDNNVVLSYSDNGKGVSPEHINKIFDPFFTTNRYKGNVGLGLNAVYNTVCEVLGGTIRCNSDIGKGTTFIIEFPAKISIISYNEAKR